MIVANVKTITTNKSMVVKSVATKLGADAHNPVTDKSSPRQKLAAAVRRASFGWLGTLTDVSLVSLYLLVAGGSAYPGNINRIYSTAGKLFSSLQAKRWQKSLQKSLSNLASAGMVENQRITNKGFARLKDLIPKYIEDRQWNGWLYLTLYDIPENLKRSRQKLRKQLEVLSYGMLQESAWVSFDDPEPFIEDIIEMNELEDFVLILKTKPVGRARKNLIPILATAYGLKNLNLRYEVFLDLVTQNQKSVEELALRFLSILKDDPQLPFRLLPENWLGNKAHQIYLKKVLPKMPHEYGQFISKLDKVV